MRRDASQGQIQRRLHEVRDPAARHTVAVCMGKECRHAGSTRLMRVVEARGGNSEIRVVKVPCLGCCGLAPAVADNDHLMGHVTEQRLESELRRLQ
jgi:NADH:ubiquinone oxidoreductase subunit E